MYDSDFEKLVWSDPELKKPDPCNCIEEKEKFVSSEHNEEMFLNGSKESIVALIGFERNGFLPRSFLSATHYIAPFCGQKYD